MNHYDSLEVDRLKKLISSKKEYLTRLQQSGNKPAFQAVQSEATYLERDVLPLVMSSTSLVHLEFAKYAIRAWETALQYRCNGLVLYQTIEQDYKDRPLIGMANLHDLSQVGTPGNIQIQIINMDGWNVTPDPLYLNTLME